MTDGVVQNLIVPSAGNETLNGGSGNDNLYGSNGTDSMTGGIGNDRFTFNTSPGSFNIDIITDFAHGLDKIILDDDIFTKIGAPGALQAGAFRKGAGVTTAGDADDRIIKLGRVSLLCHYLELQRVTRTAVYLTIRTVVWEDGGATPPPTQ